MISTDITFKIPNAFFFFFSFFVLFCFVMFCFVCLFVCFFFLSFFLSFFFFFSPEGVNKLNTCSH